MLIIVIIFSVYNKETSIREIKSKTVKDDLEIQGYKGVKNRGRSHFKFVWLVSEHWWVLNTLIKHKFIDDVH